DLKVEYYAGLSAAWRQARLETGANLLQTFDWLHALERVFEQTANSDTAPDVEAATPANRTLLRKVMAQGENDFSRSPLLKPGLGNPAYWLLAHEARQRGYTSRIVSNTHMEIRGENGLFAIF